MNSRSRVLYRVVCVFVYSVAYLKTFVLFMQSVVATQPVSFHEPRGESILKNIQGMGDNG